MTNAMTELLSNQFAPVTFSIGYVDLQLGAVADFMVAWHNSVGSSVVGQPLKGDLPELLTSCGPLTFPETKKLLVGTRSRWTAIFLNSTEVPSPSSVVAYVCRELRINGIVATCVPTTFGTDRLPVLHGVTRFEKISSRPTEYLNYERIVEVAYEDEQWTFELSGKEQSFESPDVYKSRRIKDRFTPKMLAAYCAAVGVHPFDETYYSSDAHLIESVDGEVQRRADYAEARANLQLA